MNGGHGYLETLWNAPRRRSLLSPATLLSLLAAVYGGAMVLRAELYRRHLFQRRQLPCGVVSVGNLTVGGTGKTPLAMEVAARLRDRGWPVCLLSRGYRGTAERSGAVVSDGRRILVPARVAGDEPWLMARRLPGVPVIVGRDRWASGMTAAKRFGARVVVLDDGFQHLRLSRDLDLLLCDAQKPLGNGHLLPRGPLREPATAARRAHALVRVYRAAAAGAPSQVRRRPGQLVLEAILRPFLALVAAPAGAAEPSSPGLDWLEGRRALPFSGIAGNAGFFDTVAGAGADLVGRMGFADHHRYHRADLERIGAAARRAGADCLVTTAKDHARLPPAAWPLPLAVLDLAVVWRDAGAGIDRLLEDRLAGSGSA
jgi:tetraacyldisaccharide 4'-kinase